MKLNILKKHIVKAGLLGLLSMLTLSATALAQDEKRDHERNGQVASDTAETKVAVKGISRFEPVETAQTLLATAPGAATFNATLTVQVDHSYCRTGGIQCFLPGQEPNDLNRNPVRLGLQVLNGGVPFATLTDADVDVLNSFVPAGGAAVSQITGASTFQNAGNGMYAIFVAPSVGQTWKPGAYFVQVRVNVNGVVYRALAQIEITF